MSNTEINILKKCGWKDDQLEYFGTMVYNLKDVKGNSLMDIVSHRMENEVIVEWFIPNKEGSRLAFAYSIESNDLIEKKTTKKIGTLKDMETIISTIEENIKGHFTTVKKSIQSYLFS